MGVTFINPLRSSDRTYCVMASYNLKTKEEGKAWFLSYLIIVQLFMEESGQVYMVVTVYPDWDSRKPFSTHLLP